jgi:predicted RNA-binding Zn ribbon-like protein
VQFNAYTSAGAHIAAALVNDPMTGVAAVGALLAGFDVEEPAPSEAELADLRDWTARLGSVFEPQAEAERAALVNDLLVESDCRPRLITHDGLPHHLHYKPLAGDLAARVKAFTAAGLAYLIAEGWGGRLGRCQREGCATAFVDTSRNGTRRFCSVRCANQVNVSNHRGRRRLGQVAS